MTKRWKAVVRWAVAIGGALLSVRLAPTGSEFEYGFAGFLGAGALALLWS